MRRDNYSPIYLYLFIYYNSVTILYKKKQKSDRHDISMVILPSKKIHVILRMTKKRKENANISRRNGRRFIFPLPL